jgi:hypothetical protein
MKELLLFVKYPYTAAVIATVWLGTAAFMAIDTSLPVIKMVMIDMIATLVIAVLGFRGKKEI